MRKCSALISWLHSYPTSSTPHPPGPPLLPAHTPPRKKGMIKNRRLKLKRLWRRKNNTKPTTYQPAKLSHKQRQNQNSLKEGFFKIICTNITTFHYCTLSWTTESFIFCTDVNIKIVLTDWRLFNCTDWRLFNCTDFLPTIPPNWFKWKPACPWPSIKRLRNTKMKEVGKDWELTKIAQSISHNQGSPKSGEGLGNGCHGNLCSFHHTDSTEALT